MYIFKYISIYTCILTYIHIQFYNHIYIQKLLHMYICRGLYYSNINRVKKSLRERFSKIIIPRQYSRKIKNLFTSPGTFIAEQWKIFSYYVFPFLFQGILKDSLYKHYLLIVNITKRCLSGNLTRYMHLY